MPAETAPAVNGAAELAWDHREHMGYVDQFGRRRVGAAPGRSRRAPLERRRAPKSLTNTVLTWWSRRVHPEIASCRVNEPDVHRPRTTTPTVTVPIWSVAQDSSSAGVVCETLVPIDEDDAALRQEQLENDFMHIGCHAPR